MDRKKTVLQGGYILSLNGKGKAWLGIKDPPAGEGQEGQKHLFGKGGTGWIEDYMTTQESLRRDVGKITSPCSRGYVGT